MCKIEYLIWQISYIPRYISTSPKQKLSNRINVIDYFAGDNDICE